jgi:hypothetical protein
MTPVTGKELRTLADGAWDAGQRKLSEALHDLARTVEADEERATLPS